MLSLRENNTPAQFRAFTTNKSPIGQKDHTMTNTNTNTINTKAIISSADARILGYLDQFESSEIEEVTDNLAKGKADFEAGNYRFIDEDEIDRIQQKELAENPYCLGCFNPRFLSEILEIDMDVIQSFQKVEAYEAIGKLIISLGKLEELQAGYVRFDGYGHYFAHYDGDEFEFELGGRTFYIFRIS